MRKLSIVLSSLFALMLLSCNDYGKKVKIDNTMEVYMKGDGVNENQAKKIGNYLVKLWSDSTKKIIAINKGQRNVRGENGC